MMAYSMEVWDGSAYYPLGVGVPGPRIFAQVASSAPTARATGDMWVNPNDPALTWDTDWEYPTLLNDWTDYGSGHESSRYRMLPNNVVIIMGLITSGTIGRAAFYLPPAYRPTGGRLISYTYNSGAATNSRLDITTAGAVIPNAGSGWFNIDTMFYAG